MPKPEVPVVKKDTSPIVQQRDKINFNLVFKDFPWTERQKEIIELICDKKTKMVFMDGPAGSAKSLITTYASLKLLQSKRISEINYVRSIAESSVKTIGALPGLVSEKFLPFTMPLEDKLSELLHEPDIKKLHKENRIKAIPVNFIRGASFRSSMCYIEEAQNFYYKEIVTTITRLGQFSKMVLCGDHAQSDINGKSGFKQVMDIFDNQESRDQGIFCVKLTSADIMRSGIVKFIVEKLENYRVEPMFPAPKT